MIPERHIRRAIVAGVNAITADTTLLDDILELDDADEAAKIRAAWTASPPGVILGYARANTPMPVYAIALLGDQQVQDFVGMGEEAYIDDDDEMDGATFIHRIRENYGIYTYSNHVDLTIAWYRVLRAILNVARVRFVNAGFDDPMLGGADLMPSPEYKGEDLFVRRLTISLDYSETWASRTALWTAINGAPEAVLPTGGSVVVRHEDSGGGVHPIAESEIEEDED